MTAPTDAVVLLDNAALIASIRADLAALRRHFTPDTDTTEKD